MSLTSLPRELLHLIIAYLPWREVKHLALINKRLYKIIHHLTQKKVDYLIVHHCPSFCCLNSSMRSKFVRDAFLYHDPQQAYEISSFARVNDGDEKVDVIFNHQMIPLITGLEHLTLPPTRKTYDREYMNGGWFLLTIDGRTIHHYVTGYEVLPYNLIKYEDNTYCGAYGLTSEGLLISYDWVTLAKNIPRMSNFCIYSSHERDDSVLMLVDEKGELWQYDLSYSWSPEKIENIPPVLDLVAPEDNDILFLLFDNGTLMLYPEREIITFVSKIVALIEYNSVTMDEGENGYLFACYDEQGDCHVAYRTHGYESTNADLCWSNLGRVRDLVIDNTDEIVLRGISF